MNNNKRYLDDVIQYIYDSEQDDFKENPSANHVYFAAYALEYGEKDAYKYLEETLERNK